MALYDDPFWLLSHITHSFVLSDETGNSELVLTSQDAKFVRDKAKNMAKENGTEAFLTPLTSLCDGDDTVGGAAHSFEIRLLGGRQYGGMAFHRPRCNTEIKLEKMKRERRNLPRIRTINWREQPANSNDEELDKLFPRKDLQNAITEQRSATSTSQTSSKPRSLLSAQLDMAPAADANPFEAFSQFDAQNAAANEKTRKLQVFVDMAEVGSAARNFPLVAHVRVSAKISEVVGYVCWKYTHEGRKPKLRKCLEGYSLYMAESDGSIERDFPALDRRELLSKYGFTVLGLVDELPASEEGKEPKAAGAGAASASFSVTVVLPDGTFSVLELESKDLSVKQLLERALNRRREANPRIGYKYNVELKNSPGEALDPEALLSSLSSTEFYIVREHSRRRRLDTDDASAADADDSGKTTGAKGRLRPQISAAEAGLYKEYDEEVYLLSSMRTRVDVVLAFSEEGLEVYPKQSRGAPMFWKNRKHVKYSMEDLVACDIVDTKQSGRWVFRIVIHNETGYKKQEFEASEDVAEEIHDKINYLLKGRPSAARAEYLAYKERKLARKNWHIKVK